ncbi:hypothetical protein L1987_81211 [Smallanthus sonchifolius]|uniref:Uncharacterized protein n=1 Tax=Smallanthus sonchifolius TaxID=185202 RepID=A0ACB8YQ92_9ASTR|nr:hypothetical protein L1987_81211 [Smallanthus sonchifolius]
MGKASRFFKALFGSKPPESTHLSAVDKQPKRRWSFFKSHHHLSDASVTRPRDTPRHRHFSDHTDRGHGSTNHAIVVAAADAAEEVVRMLSRTTAAVKIQTYFRGYLARKALRALKSLVKLQALVRGHIQRKQAADDLRWLQARVRVHQARARTCWFQITESPQSTIKVDFSIHGPPTPEKFEHGHRSRGIKHNQPSMLKNNGSKFHDERNEKLLEIETMKPHIRRRSLFQPDHISYSQSQSLTTSRGSTVHQMGPSPSGSCEVSSLSAPFKCYPHDFEEQVSAQNSPPFYAVSSKNGLMRVSPLTPAKSDSSRSGLSGYSDHPNYMAYTESSLAKVRSLSAPRPRPNFELPSTMKRYSVYGYGSGTQRGSNLRDSFVSKAYPGSGRLDRLGMPVGMGFRESEFSGGYWN